MRYLQNKFAIICSVIATTSLLGAGLITLAELDLAANIKANEYFVCSELVKKLGSQGGASEVDLTVNKISSTIGNTITCEINTVYIDTKKPLKATAQLVYGEGLTISFIKA